MGLISILLCKVRHTSVLFRWVLELVRSLFYHAAWCFCPHCAQRSLNYSRVTRSPAFVPFGTSAAVFCDPRLVPWDDLASPWPPLLRRELFPSQLPALRAAFCSSQHRFYLFLPLLHPSGHALGSSSQTTCMLPTPHSLHCSFYNCR